MNNSIKETTKLLLCVFAVMIFFEIIILAYYVTYISGKGF